MNKIVECAKHGEQQAIFVCQHLVKALKTNRQVGFYYAGELRGDAWCEACEKVRVREGGETGEWNERSEQFADVTLICSACYDRLRVLHGV